MTDKLSRRGFLIVLSGSALAAAAGCRPSGLAVPTAYAPGSTLPPANTPAPSPVLQATSAGPDPKYGAITYDKIIITTPDNLYDTQYDYSNTPTLDPATWSLKIDGLVDNPMTLTYDDVKAFSTYEEMRTIECIGNPVGGGLIGNVLWKGFHLEDLLGKIRVKSTATHAKFQAADGYSTSVELKWITQPNVMMAYMMNGAPLTTLHGFPLRIMMPGLYGQKMPRWIQHIEFIDQDYIGYWEGNGYSNIASVKTNSIIQSPPDGTAVTAHDQVAIQGVAYGAPRRITKVEVRIDSGDWQPAQLTPGPNGLTWTQWYLTWTPNAPGAYQVAVRATDETGFVQTHDASGPFGSSSRDGTDAIHTIGITAT
ncbi:MAG: molybdopterin-dependent oxidoreductase [Aggregatilineales bacterium]